MDMKKALPEIVLASGSPRRAEMLEKLKIHFVKRVVDLDESPLTGESAPDYTLRLAREKAEAAAGKRNEIIIAADTTVTIDGAILGKPADKNEAEAMLKQLSGRSHEVLTAVALSANETHADICATEVVFRQMTEKEIAWYISTGEPMDKAGAYGIQGFASLFIEGMKGSYSNVVGLPIQLLERLFLRHGFQMIDFIRINS